MKRIFDFAEALAPIGEYYILAIPLLCEVLVYIFAPSNGLVICNEAFVSQRAT